jgi:prepilin-type N-terminal cleavage/methylation domain-containing protein
MSFRISSTPPRGFTLVEIAVVLGIVAILLTIGIAALTALATNQAITETRKKQDTIRDALIAHLGRTGRLPCPDTSVPPNGAGDDNRITPGDPTTLCGPPAGVALPVASGVVPFAELGLAREIALDGWSNYMTYQVTNTVPPTTHSWTISFNPITGNGFRVGSPGNMIVTERTFPGGVPVAANLIIAAPVVLISHGLNGSGATTLQGTVNVPPAALTDEANNLDGDGTVIRRQSTEAVIAVFGAFDDIVAFYSTADMTGSLVQGGSIASPASELNRRMADLRQFVLSFAATNRCIPAAAAIPVNINLNNPWGGLINYARVAAVPLDVLLPAPGAVAYTLTYNDDTGAAIVVTMLVDEFKTIAITGGQPVPGACP